MHELGKLARQGSRALELERARLRGGLVLRFESPEEEALFLAENEQVRRQSPSTIS